MKTSNFYLQKLYLDSIDDKGNCFVVYWAYLKLFFIEIYYSGYIFSDLKGQSFEKSSLKRTSKPIVTDILSFKNQQLSISGEWEKIDKPISILLFTDEAGRDVYWDCHHPKCLTNINFENSNYTGLGYAETLTLHIKPWLLPIDELRWGRILSENNTIIWICWKGANPINKIFCNGRVYEDAEFGENCIKFDNGKSILKFQDKSIIRSGRLTKILSKMPWLKLLFGSRILNTNEIKYKAQSTYGIESETIDSGWALFEIVTWSK